MKALITIFLLFPVVTFAQLAIIKIEAKTMSKKDAYHYIITKKADEIKIVFKKVDSIIYGNLSKGDRHLLTKMMAEVVSRTVNSNDSLIYYQEKIDSLTENCTFYKSDSTAVYPSSHQSYGRLVEKVLKTPNVILEKNVGSNQKSPSTIYVFKLSYGVPGADRRIVIDSNEPNNYPLLGGLIKDTEAIIRAHLKVMGKRNQ